MGGLSHKLGATDEKAGSPELFFSFKLGYFRIRLLADKIIARLFFNNIRSVK